MGTKQSFDRLSSKTFSYVFIFLFFLQRLLSKSSQIFPSLFLDFFWLKDEAATSSSSLHTLGFCLLLWRPSVVVFFLSAESRPLFIHHFFFDEPLVRRWRRSAECRVLQADYSDFLAGKKRTRTLLPFQLFFSHSFFFFF